MSQFSDCSTLSLTADAEIFRRLKQAVVNQPDTGDDAKTVTIIAPLNEKILVSYVKSGPDCEKGAMTWGRGPIDVPWNPAEPLGTCHKDQ